MRKAIRHASSTMESQATQQWTDQSSFSRSNLIHAILLQQSAEVTGHLSDEFPRLRSITSVGNRLESANELVVTAVVEGDAFGNKRAPLGGARETFRRQGNSVAGNSIAPTRNQPTRTLNGEGQARRDSFEETGLTGIEYRPRRPKQGESPDERRIWPGNVSLHSPKTRETQVVLLTIMKAGVRDSPRASLAAFGFFSRTCSEPDSVTKADWDVPAGRGGVTTCGVPAFSI